jgi:hypothetical protein
MNVSNPVFYRNLCAVQIKFLRTTARTIIRWLKLPEFNAAYREARRATFSQSIARLQQATSAAVSTLLR